MSWVQTLILSINLSFKLKYFTCWTSPIKKEFESTREGSIITGSLSGDDHNYCKVTYDVDHHHKL